MRRRQLTDTAASGGRQAGSTQMLTAVVNTLQAVLVLVLLTRVELALLLLLVMMK
jgi:hypothetical protein